MKKLFLVLTIALIGMAANAQTDSLQQYTGKFKFPDGSPVTEITTTIENGVLMASSAIGTTEFKATSTAGVFEVVAYGGTATFKKKEGKVVTLLIQVADVNMEGTKTDGTNLSSKSPVNLSHKER